uniref:Glutathione S-transferase 12 n=1 Tax=Subpsaltria yangi TaxID=1195109 RepID=A0A2L1DGB2_9HEMI|nr:glutathione S-transferase 12 [Subpsaltria yangi]
MTIKLYYLDYSPPARAVNLTVNALGLNVEYIIINLLEKEHMKPEFLKINPQHSIPVIDDDGFILWDSHAISQYLVSKYGKADDPLYPKDLQKRARVDQRLHYSNDVFYVLRHITRQILFYKKKFIAEEDKVEAKRVIYDKVEKFLEGNDWIAGDTMTIADFHYIATIATIKHFVPLGDGYPNLKAWMERCAEKMTNYETACGNGADGLGNFVLQLISGQ